jgi:metal transporter CNNM
MGMFNYLVIAVLLLLSALFSGLTLGLMSLDPFELHRKAKLGDKHAKRVYPLRKKGNLLLSTLLIGNVAVNSTLAIFLGSLTAGVLAGSLATGLIVVFGEILPQAFFARYALRLGSKAIPFVYVVMGLLYPITKPISFMLDKMLGRELPATYTKGEFKLLLQQQKELKRSDLSKHEFSILEKGLIFADRQVKDVMTQRTNVFFVRVHTALDRDLLDRIYRQGHSRIPVFDRSKDKVVGLLYSKDLVAINPADRKKVEKVMRKQVHFIQASDRLDKVMNLFKEKRLHLFIVKDAKHGLAGIITLEDVLEEIVGEIMDEYDWVIDMRKAHEHHKPLK